MPDDDRHQSLQEYDEWRATLTPLTDAPRPRQYASRGRCVYCGKPARRYRRTCADHADLEDAP